MAESPFRPVTIEDTRVVTHEALTLPDGTVIPADKVWLHNLCEDYLGEIRDLRARLATAETALADRDRHFLWDDRLRMEREIGDLALRLATVEAERDRWQARAEWCDTVRNSMDEPCYVPATRDYAGGWCIVGVPGFYATRWEAIDAACSTIPSHTPNKET